MWTAYENPVYTEIKSVIWAHWQWKCHLIILYSFFIDILAHTVNSVKKRLGSDMEDQTVYASAMAFNKPFKKDLVSIRCRRRPKTSVFVQFLIQHIKIKSLGSYTQALTFPQQVLSLESKFIQGLGVNNEFLSRVSVITLNTITNHFSARHKTFV